MPSPDSRHPRRVAPSARTAGRSASAPRGAFQQVIARCRACARLCSALLDGDAGGDEATEMIGDCALTCGSLVQLLASGTRMDRRQALLVCAEDCRSAAMACRQTAGDPRFPACERACMECAAACALAVADPAAT